MFEEWQAYHPSEIDDAAQYANAILNLTYRWKFYDHAVEKIDFLKIAAEKFEPEAEQVILDVGCAHGADIFRLRHELGVKSELHGIEKYAGSLALIGYRTDDGFIEAEPDETIHIRQGIAEHIDMEDNSVDILLASRMLYHVSDLKATLREFQRVVKPGGKIAITTTSKNNKDNQRQFELGQAENAKIYGHETQAPPPFVSRFNNFHAREVLPRYFESVEEVSQVTEARFFNDDDIDVVLGSLDSMRSSYRPNLVPSELWNDFKQETIVPKIIKKHIEEKGYYSDRIEQYMYICRNPH